MSIANNLKTIRARYGYSQERFAELMEVSRSMINSYEQSKANPPHKFLLSLAKMTGITPEVLMYKDILMENLPREMGMNGVNEAEESPRYQRNLYDLRNLVEEVKSLREEVSKLKGQKG